MYSNFKFQSAKTKLAYALLNNPDDRILRIECAFLRHLLGRCAQQGYVSDQDIQRAIESSGACDLDPEVADDMIAHLWKVGDDYAGALSARQAAELRRIRKLCLRAIERRDADATATIAELL